MLAGADSASLFAGALDGSPLYSAANGEMIKQRSAQRVAA